MEKPPKIRTGPVSKKAFLTPPGLGGHQMDYTLNVEGFNLNSGFIPESFTEEFRQALGENWDVSNRGSRLEFIRKDSDSIRDDDSLIKAIEKVLGPKGYEIDM